MRTLTTSNQILIEDAKDTFLDTEASSGDNTITVENIAGFETDQILLIGNLGDETAEIIKTDSSTSPSGNTVTLASSLSFAHSQGTKVYIIQWNKLEISHSSTKDGSKSVLDTIDIQPDQKKTSYTDTSKDDGYYFVRFKNDIDSSYSSYSDPIPYGDYDTNQVGHAVDYALARTNLDDFTDDITMEFCIDEINSCLKNIHGKRKSWHNLQEFDYELGTLVEDQETLDCPDNMWSYSNASIVDIYLKDKTSLDYLDEREWNDKTAGDDSTGEPQYYTVKEGSVHFYPIPDSSIAGTKVMVDYWKEAPEVDSMGDTLDAMRYDMVKYYLTAAIRWERENDGKPDLEDGHYQLYQEALSDALKKENKIHGQENQFKPDLNTIDFNNA